MIRARGMGLFSWMSPDPSAFIYIGGAGQRNILVFIGRRDSVWRGLEFWENHTVSLECGKKSPIHTVAVSIYDSGFWAGLIPSITPLLCLVRWSLENVVHS
jgi:hypothetical protein